MVNSAAIRHVIDRAADRHGGWARYQALDTIVIEVESLSGAVPRTKGLGRTYPKIDRCTVQPRIRRIRAHDFPASGQDTVFDQGRVSTGPTGHLPDPNGDDYRRRFTGLARFGRWGPKDATYFFGYALTHYLGLPFSLAEANVVEHRHRPGHALPDRLTVRYPAGAHTHGEIERFHFDESGLLRRHDYHTEIMGPGTHGAHFSDDYVEVDGLQIARERSVKLRLGSWATPLTVLHARLRPGV